MVNSMTLKNLLFILSTTLCSININANVYQIGSNKSYLTPNELYAANVLQNGDTIEIDAENFTGQDALAVWFANDLLIRGIGGKPHLIANGQYIFGKGIWVLAGDNITVENIEFSGAAVPDKNGAGIRLDGKGMTIKYCYFHNNENGILTTNNTSGDILIEHSEFGYNGFGDGYSHNIYVNSASTFTFRYNYSHHANVGHTLKSRAAENYIYYNRFTDEATGIASRLIDIANGGFTVIMGNLLMQGINATNNNLIGYGLEGLSNSNSQLHAINNTMVNKRVNSCIYFWIQNGTPIATVRNNIFAGTGTLIQGSVTANSNNYVSVNIENVAFVDEANYDYKLTANSPAIDFGSAVAAANETALTPNKAYLHPNSFTNRVVSNGTIDAGAYEFGNNVIPATAANCQMSVQIGDICVKNSDYGLIMTAPNGNCFRLKISNTGALTTELVDCE